MSNLPERKNIRLKNYDYSQNGIYFITICTHEKVKLFGRIVEAAPMSPIPEYRMELSENGRILESVIEHLPLRYPGMKIEKYVIMPNHIHLLIDVDDGRAIRESPLQKRSLISKSVGYLKMNASKMISAQNGKNIAVWQRSYYDHIVRNERSYLEIWQYIDDNPAKWFEDSYYVL